MMMVFSYSTLSLSLIFLFSLISHPRSVRRALAALYIGIPVAVGRLDQVAPDLDCEEYMSIAVVTMEDCRS